MLLAPTYSCILTFIFLLYIHSMHHEYHYLEDKKARLHYSKYGSGPKVLLCFHGYGQSLRDFREIEDQLKDIFTIYSFDIFFHGQSFWHDKDKPISKKEWCTLIERFFKKHDINKFSLMGFSMGGKFVLSVLECYPEKIDKITLIAPDGIQTSFWYNLAAYPSWTRGLFRRIILMPGFYFNFLKALHFFRLADKGVLRFAENQMKTREQRRRVYYTWVVFKELKFDLKEIAGLLKKHHIRVEMFLGVHDKIIKAENMDNLLKRIDNYELILLDSGHTHLMKAVAEHFKENNRH
jgi:pimeloyl-ACP methyl ester carboxylesterase